VTQTPPTPPARDEAPGPEDQPAPAATDEQVPAAAAPVPLEATAAQDEAGQPGPVRLAEDDQQAGAAQESAQPAGSPEEGDATREQEPIADLEPAVVEPTSPSSSPVPTPQPTPRPRPTPAAMRPGPRPASRPGPAAPAPTTAPAPPVDPEEAARAAAFGRVDEEANVYVQDDGGERLVGQVPGSTGADALALYVRRYLDLLAKVVLFEARLTAADLSVKEIDQTLTRLSEELAEPPVVGDLPGLRARLDGLREIAADRRRAVEAERLAAREKAMAERTQIVEQAEKIAQTDPSRIQWRPAGDQLRQLLDAWKDAQRNGPRLDRAGEESLWKRFSHARTTFDRERRHYFAELEARNSEARAVKEDIVAQAEALATSTDWGATAGAYRDLMTRWKSAGRAARQVDDALWARFRAAQDAFFAARDAASAATDAEFTANLQVKLALLTEAEALLPVKDLAAAKAALRSVQARWESAGKVPRADVQRVEGRLRAVESAVREAEDSAWRRSNPETRARAEGLAAQLEAAIDGLERDLARAQAAGDARRVAAVTSDLEARRAWLDQAQAAARDSRG
jgi:hypothetical protein